MTRTRDTALLGAVLVLAGWLFDAPALDVPGVMLLVVAGVCELWVRAAARDVALVRDLDRTRVAEDEPVDVGVLIRSTAVGCPSGELEDPFLDGRTARLQPGRRAQRIRIRASFARRGRRRLDPPRVVVRDPLGMATRTVSDGAAAELLVLPRTEPLAEAGRVAGERPGPWLRSLAAADVELDGLRPYRPGAPASRIYWPGLARGAGLNERRLSSGHDERALVALDARARNGDDLDAAVRAAASICRHLGAAHGCRLGLPGRRRALDVGPSLRGWEAALTQLALVEAGGRPSATVLAQRRGLLIWVTGERVTRAPEALLRSGASTRILVVPGAIPGRTPRFTVAGCSAYVLGQARPGGAVPAVLGGEAAR